MRRPKLTRRGLLGGMAGAAAATPWFLHPSRPAHAALGGPPRRLINLFTANGSRWNQFFPDDAGLSPAQWDNIDPADNIRRFPLAQMQGPISNVLGEELDPFRDKILVLRGLDAIANTASHRANYMLTAARTPEKTSPPEETIDQILARSECVYPTEPHRRSLHLQARLADEGLNVPISAEFNGSEVVYRPNITDPVAAHEHIFGEFDVDDFAALQDKRDRRAELVARLAGQYDGVSQHVRLGADDQAVLASHGSLLGDLEAQLRAPLPTCTIPAVPSAVDATTPLETILKDFVDLVVGAVRCDISRVFNLQLAGAGSLVDFGFLDPAIGGYHGVSHTSTELAATHMGKIQNFYAKAVAYLLEQLDVVEDADTGATYLDNSLVFWGNEMGSANAGTHRQKTMPVFLAGGLAGRIETGYYYDFRAPGERILYEGPNGDPKEYGAEDFRGRPYNELLVTILQAMGLTPEEYEQGEAGVGTYGNNYVDQYTIGDRRTPLPFFIG